MKRVVIVTRNLVDYGGTPYALVNLAEGWRSASPANPFFLHYIILEQASNDLLSVIQQSGVTVAHLNAKSRVSQLWNLKATLDHCKYEWVVCTCFRTFSICKILLGRRKKVILWLHGSAVVDRGLRKAVFRLTNNIFTITNSKYTAVRNGISDFKVVYNGVSASFLQADSSDFHEVFHLPLNSRVIGYIGGWNRLKNHDTLIRAFNSIYLDYGDLYLVCIGLKSKLTPLAYNDVKDPSRVRFVNGFPFAARYLRHFQVYAHPCDQEAFGLSVVEAMYAGVPIVAANAGGLPEIIDNNISGLLYDNPRIENDLVLKIKELLDSKPLSDRLVAAAKETALRRFCSSSFAQSFFGVLETGLQAQESH